MADINSTSCCGLNEIHGVGYPPKDILLYVGERFVEQEERVPFYFFTDTREVGGGSDGKNLASYITKHKLGRIVQSRYKRNPNSGNMLRVWIWETNKRNFIRWYNKNNPDWAENNI